MIAISAVSILLIIYCLGEEEPPHATWVVLAVLLALGMLTKLSFWPMLPLSALAVVLVALRFRSWRIFFVVGILLLGGVALLGSWWVFRNWRLYGDFTGLSSMWSVWGVRAPLTWQDYTLEFHNFRTTFWANFGYGNVPMPSWVYTLLDVVSLGGVGGILVRTVQFLRTRHTLDAVLRDRLIMLGTWGFLTVAALIWYLQKTIAVTGRQTFTILPGIALVLVAGWAALFPSKERLVALGLSGGMGLLATGALIGVLIPSYALPARIPAGSGSEQIEFPVDWEIGDKITLRGYSLAAKSANPGDAVQLTLFWEAHGRIDQNYTVFVHVFDPEGRQIGSRDTYPGLGNYPTIYWTPREIVKDRIPVPISPDVDGPYLAEIEVGLYDLNTGERLPVLDSAGNTVGYPVIGHIKINQTRQVQSLPQHDLRVAFEQGIQLAGYAFSSSTPAPGDELIVSLFWNPEERPSNDYTVFVQLLNSEDQIVSQGDGVPQDGHYPTSAWGPGEYFADDHRVLLPAEVPPGNYRVRIGLYEPVSGIRLVQEDGRDFVDLPQNITIP